MTKITKILIANRGEIACRVMRTAAKMGIKTVAVYSDADKDAMHVKMADEAVHIGPSPAAESYLVINKIIKAARDTDANAIHPGYGFLSENPAFVRACDQAGIIFIGPKAASIEAMGLKDAAKKLMIEAGVPVTPGYHGDNQDPKYLQTQADEIGYPILIKAVAGGGGKGMRKVDTAKDFLDSLASCQREARSSFGDDHVLIEKLITSPRHIEVQVFGDSHGNVVHMYERDCSLQRRHQKVIEEAPAPGMTEDVRAAMTDAAVKAAQAVNYIGAGTVEFIVDGSGPLRMDGFWFMEMNTRLQVEHPVTELVTGIDLVALQIRVAEGAELHPQDEIGLEGHAIEARLYAEDPTKDFLPSVGRLDILTLPGLHRVDTGVEQGGAVSQFYDPMIAKLIAFHDVRVGAIMELEQMCAMTQIYPIRTNARFLHACLKHDAFIQGDISTNFIAQHEADLFAPTDNGALLNAVSYALNDDRPCDSGWRLNLPARDVFYRDIDGEPQALPLSASAPKDSYVNAVPRSEGMIVFVDGLYYTVMEAGGSADGALGGNAITAPMPGKILAVNVKTGDAVTAGQSVIVMEAMKMEMALEAPRDGVIKAVHASVGDLVGDGDILVELEE